MVPMDLWFYQPVCGFQEELSEPMSAMSGEVTEIMIGKRGARKGKDRNKAGPKRDPTDRRNK